MQDAAEAAAPARGAEGRQKRRMKIKRKRRSDMECSPDDLIAQILWVMLRAYRSSRRCDARGALLPLTEAELLQPAGVGALLTNIDFIDTFHLFNLDITALG